MAGIAENHHSTLPQKEAALFKRLLKMYEQKQYKTALKLAKQILANPKCVDHGETLAMKGLTLSYLGRKEEAYEDVKRGLKCDLKSYVCWHVYGLLQRGDKKYEEAMKCYVNALKIDKDNVQILRDLATLQIQLRDLDGFRETRYRIAVLRPGQKSHWLAYAVALHLQGDLSLAIRVMEECRKLAHPERMDDCDVEYGEYILYQLELMIEAGHFQDAVEHSLRYEGFVYDQVSLLEGRVKALLSLSRYQEANQVLSDLIRRNSENWSYYRQLAFPVGDKKDLKEYCLHIQKNDSYSRTAYKIPLTLSEGEEFRELVGAYLRRGFHKGLPSLFNDVKIVYNDNSKVDIIEEELLRILPELRSKRNGMVSEAENEAPASALLWLYYYLAQHYDQKNDYQKAMEYIEQAIEHTPTLVEAYSFKAKIFKHMNELQNAADVMEEAQSLDTSDRFINYKAGKYLLRANLVEKAEALLGRFTREGIKPSENLCDMQCFWFMVENARALKRLGRFGEALKFLHLVDRHFLDIVDDQLDFHAYCLRKSTIRSYVSLIRMEDSVRQHKFYVNAAILAAQIYLILHEKNPSESDDDDANADPSLSATERRKLRNKQRKAKKKAENEKIQQESLDKAKTQSAKVKKDEDEPAATQKEDLIPEKLVKPDDPLEMACYFLRPLLMLDVPRFDLHEVIFEVYRRKGKPLVALRSLVRMFQLDPANPKLALFRKAYLELENQTGTLPEGIQDINKNLMEQVKSWNLKLVDNAVISDGEIVINNNHENHMFYPR